MRWHYTDYPQKTNYSLEPDICLVETSDGYKLLWFNKKNKWWYDCDTNEPYADSTRNFKWIFLDDILGNFEQTINNTKGEQTMTDRELATYESVNAMLMLIGDFLHKVDNYREHIYDKKLESKLIGRINNSRDTLNSIASDLVDYKEFWIKKHNIKTSD